MEATTIVLVVILVLVILYVFRTMTTATGTSPIVQLPLSLPLSLPQSGTQDQSAAPQDSGTTTPPQGTDGTQSGSGNTTTQSSPAAAKVSLVKQRSKTACKENETYGIDPTSKFVWVDRGCAGDFQVSGPGGTEAVACSSDKFARKTCSYGQPQTALAPNTITLKKQKSKAKCISGSTFGIDTTNRFVWVDRGCEGEFTVQPSGKTVKCGSKKYAYGTCPY